MGHNSGFTVIHNGATMPMPGSVEWTVSIARIQEKESAEAGVHFKEVRLELRIRKEYLNLGW